MHKIAEIKALKDRFMKIASSELDKGVECVDTHEMREVVDMIKDLAEAEEKCAKAKYYCAIVEAMEEAELDEEDMDEIVDADEWLNERRGYRGRSKSSGRFTHRGRPTRDSGAPAGMHMANRGFPYYPQDPRTMTPEMNNMHPHQQPNMPDMYNRYGKHYDEYTKYKRSYTDTKSAQDKDGMSRHAKEHVDDAVETMKEIWRDSEPDLRKKMKSELTALLAEMN